MSRSKGQLGDICLEAQRRKHRLLYDNCILSRNQTPRKTHSDHLLANESKHSKVSEPKTKKKNIEMSEQDELNTVSDDEMMSNNENKLTEGTSAEPDISDESDNEPIAKPKGKKALKRKGKTPEPQVEPIAAPEEGCICARANYQIKCLKCKKCFVGRIFEKCPVHTRAEKLMDAEFCLYCGQEALIKRSEEADYSGSDCDEEFDDMDSTSDGTDSGSDESDSESDRTLIDIPSSDSEGDDQS